MRKSQLNKAVPWAVYIVATTIFGLPVIAIGVRLLSGMSAFSNDRHVEASLLYGHCALVLVAAMVVMKRQADLGSRIAAWTIHFGSFFCAMRLLQDIIKSFRRGEPLLENIVAIFVFLAFAVVLNLMAWRARVALNR